MTLLQPSRIMMPSVTSNYSSKSKRRSIRDVCLRTIISTEQQQQEQRDRNGNSKRPTDKFTRSRSSRSFMSDENDDDDDATIASIISSISMISTDKSTAYSASEIFNLVIQETKPLQLQMEDIEQQQDEEQDQVVELKLQQEQVEPAAVCTTNVAPAPPTNIAETKKAVSFSTVQIKEYSVILGDNPNASYPLSLDWGHTQGWMVTVNEHKFNSNHGVFCDTRRLNADARIARLTTMGFTKKELRCMERDRKMSLLREWKDSQYYLDDDEEEDDDDGDGAGKGGGRSKKSKRGTIVLPPPRAMRID
jgi:hypothetical protein